MFNKQIFLGFVLSLFIFAIGTASASTITVGPTGDFTTIQEAIDVAIPGDTILVNPGVYNENVNVTKQLTIKSINGASVTNVNGLYPGDWVFEVMADGVTISGFNITTTIGGIIFGGIGLYGNNSTITNNMMSYAGHGISVNGVSNNIINNNIVLNNGYGINGFGIYFATSNNNTITNNRLIGSSAKGVGIGLTVASDNNTLVSNVVSDYGEGISNPNGLNNLYLNNTVSNNTRGIIPAWNCTLISNTVVNNEQGIYLAYTRNCTLISNTVLNNEEGIIIDHYENYILINNTVLNNGQGIILSASKNVNLNGNTVSNNVREGIYLNGCENSTLTSNTVSNNGIGLHTSTGSYTTNLIYNNLFNNSININSDGGTNIWNTTQTTGTNIIGGSYLGGNYWATPEGSGFSQTHADSDANGICDESYVMSSDNIDHLPLAYPTSTPADWNPWNDPDSAGGESITLVELQTAIYDWRFGTALSTGETLSLTRLQGLIYSWRFV